MTNHQTFKNLFATFPDLLKLMFHINHYCDNMNKAKTGVYFCHNLDLFLFNINHFKNLIKYSTKRAENVLYYPFSGKNTFHTLEPKTTFLDFENNQLIQQVFEEKNVQNLFLLLNKNISKLNNLKQSKAQLLECFDNIEKYTWVLYTCFKLFIDEYEKTFKKPN